MFDAVFLTHIVGHRTRAAAVIPNRHASSADATEDQSLQQGRAFTRRTLPTIMPVRLRILMEQALVLFVLLPGDVTGMQAGQQDPLVAGSLQTPPRRPASGESAFVRRRRPRRNGDYGVLAGRGCELALSRSSRLCGDLSSGAGERERPAGERL